jgi:hypothetical protein
VRTTEPEGPPRTGKSDPIAAHLAVLAARTYGSERCRQGRRGPVKMILPSRSNRFNLPDHRLTEDLLTVPGGLTACFDE